MNLSGLLTLRDNVAVGMVLLANRKLSNRLTFRGLQISIETDKGETRTGVDKAGKPWSVVMPWPYGYIRLSMGPDGDHVDCFIGPDENADEVYIIHQTTEEAGDSWDEDKCMLGFPSADAAKIAYKSAYNNVDLYHSMSAIPFALFKKKVLATKDKVRHDKITASFNEEDHPRGPDGKFTDSGNPKLTPAAKHMTLKNAGFYLHHTEDGKDVYVHQSGKVAVEVSKYNTTHAGNENLRKFSVKNEAGKVLFQGHQFSKASTAVTQALGVIGKPGVAPSAPAAAPAAHTANTGPLVTYGNSSHVQELTEQGFNPTTSSIGEKSTTWIKPDTDVAVKTYDGTAADGKPTGWEILHKDGGIIENGFSTQYLADKLAEHVSPQSINVGPGSGDKVTDPAKAYGDINHAMALQEAGYSGVNDHNLNETLWTKPGSTTTYKTDDGNIGQWTKYENGVATANANLTDPLLAHLKETSATPASGLIGDPAHHAVLQDAGFTPQNLASGDATIWSKDEASSHFMTQKDGMAVEQAKNGGTGYAGLSSSNLKDAVDQSLAQKAAPSAPSIGQSNQGPHISEIGSQPYVNTGKYALESTLSNNGFKKVATDAGAKTTTWAKEGVKGSVVISQNGFSVKSSLGYTQKDGATKPNLEKTIGNMAKVTSGTPTTGTWITLPNGQKINIGVGGMEKVPGNLPAGQSLTTPSTPLTPSQTMSPASVDGQHVSALTKTAIFGLSSNKSALESSGYKCISNASGKSVWAKEGSSRTFVTTNTGWAKFNNDGLQMKAGNITGGLQKEINNSPKNIVKEADGSSWVTLSNGQKVNVGDAAPPKAAYGDLPPELTKGTPIPAGGKISSLDTLGYKYMGTHPTGTDYYAKDGSPVIIKLTPTDATHTKWDGVNTKNNATSSGATAGDMTQWMQQQNPQPVLSPSTKTAAPPSPSEPAKDWTQNTDKAWQAKAEATIGGLWSKAKDSEKLYNNSNSVYKQAAAALGVPMSSLKEVENSIDNWQGSSLGTPASGGNGGSNKYGEWAQQIVNGTDQVHPGAYIVHLIAGHQLDDKFGGVPPDLWRGLDITDTDLSKAQSAAAKANVAFAKQLVAVSPTNYAIDFPMFGAEGFTSTSSLSFGKGGIKFYKPSGSIPKAWVMSSRDLDPTLWDSHAGEHEWAIACPNNKLPISKAKGDAILTAEDKHLSLPEFCEKFEELGWGCVITGDHIMLIPPPWLTNEAWLKEARKPQNQMQASRLLYPGLPPIMASAQKATYALGMFAGGEQVIVGREKGATLAYTASGGINAAGCIMVGFKSPVGAAIAYKQAFNCSEAPSMRPVALIGVSVALKRGFNPLERSQRTVLAEFDESEHPRDEHGKFTNSLGEKWNQSMEKIGYKQDRNDSWIHNDPHVSVRVTYENGHLTVTDRNTGALKDASLQQDWNKSLEKMQRNVVLKGKIVKWGISPEQSDLLRKYGLKMELMPSSNLEPYEYDNWKDASAFVKTPAMGGTEGIDKIKDAMRSGAIFHPLLVSSDNVGGYYVEDGHHRFVSASELGEKRCGVIDVSNMTYEKKAALFDEYVSTKFIADNVKASSLDKPERGQRNIIELDATFFLTTSIRETNMASL